MEQLHQRNGDAPRIPRPQTNVGALVESTTLKQYKSKLVQLPKSLFSHNDQSAQWQTSATLSSASGGWLGRACDQILASSDGFYFDLLKWFGEPASAMSDVLPNIGNFLDASSAASSLGMF